MNEKIYKSLTGAGAASITIGVISLAVGITSGVILLVNGGILLARRKDLLI